MKLKNLLLTASIGMFILAPSPASADTVRDFETIAKVIGFVDGGPKGDVTIDVLYDPGNSDSSAHADEVVGLISGGVGKKVKITGNKITSAADATSPVIFLTRGTNGLYGAALEKAAANKGLTVSTDLGCLGSGCVLVVQTQPSIDILVSTAAASQTGTEFASAFSMMITKK